MSSPVAEKRATLLGDDRDAATGAAEAVSLLGGREALLAIADFEARWASDREMVGHGQSALRRMQVDPKDLAQVIQGDPDAGHRGWAAWTAGIQQVEGCQPALIAALKDPDAGVRSKAIGALASIGGFGASDALLHAAVHDPDPANRDKATEAVGTLGAKRPARPSIDEALGKLGSADPFERLSAAKDLHIAKDRRAVGPLLAALQKETDLGVKKELISALADTRDEIAVPTLIEAARHGQPDVRAFGIAALATLDDSRAVAPLTGLVRDPDAAIRRYSVRALTLLARPGVVTAIQPALTDPVLDVRLEVAKSLITLADRSAAPDIAARLGDEPDPAVREVLTRGLGELGTAGDASEEKALLRGLEDDDAGVRAASAGALSRIGSKARSEKPLRSVLEKEAKKKKEERDEILIEVATDALKAVETRGGAGEGPR